MNIYTVCTDDGSFQVEAAELTAEVEEKRGISYLLAFDENGDAIAYFENVHYYIKHGENNKIKYYAYTGEGEKLIL